MPFYSITTGGGLVEAATFAALPATGATETLYVVTATNTLYRWSGSAYVEVSAAPAELVEAANLAAFPATGATGKLYVAQDTGKVYRWSGSAYVEVSGSDWSTITGKPSTFAPSAHAASHATGGADAITPASIGASATGHGHAATDIATALGNDDLADDLNNLQGQIGAVYTYVDTGLGQKAQTSHVHGIITNDGKIGTTSGLVVTTGTGGALQASATIAAASVSGLAASATTDATNATNIASGTLAIGRIPTGTTSSTVCVGNDSRLSDARTPLSHTHAASDISSGTVATARLASGAASASTYLRGDQTWAAVASYTLPNATTTTLGGVIVGAGLSVSSGTVSANVASVAGRTGTVTLAHSDVANSPATLTQFSAAQNNLALGAGGIVRISSSAAVNVTGFVATNAGDARLLSNVGTFAITLKHSDAASTAANRILCAGNADVEIPAGGSAVVYYDGTDSRWRVG